MQIGIFVPVTIQLILILLVGGDRLKWYDVYFIDEEGNEEERGICCPSLAIAQKWFREVKNIDILVYNCACSYLWEVSKANNGTDLILFDEKGDDADRGCWTTCEGQYPQASNKLLN